MTMAAADAKESKWRRKLVLRRNLCCCRRTRAEDETSVPPSPPLTPPKKPSPRSRPDDNNNNSDATPARTQRWLSSFHRSDPRHMVNGYFSRGVPSSQGAAAVESASRSSTVPAMTSSFVSGLGPTFFTVWRPTSSVAIRRMIAGEAVGKGLEVKGKSARDGALSGYVPFLQIHREEDKGKVKTVPRGGRVRIFYPTVEARNAVAAELLPYQDRMLNAVHDAKRVVRDSVASTIARSGRDAAGLAGTLASSLGRAVGADAAASSIASAGRRVSNSGMQAVAGVSSSVGSAVGADAAASTLRSTVQFMAVVGLGISREKVGQQKESEYDWALKRLLWDMDDPSIKTVDTYAPRCYGIELPERLLWQAFVVDQDISRPEGSELYTARPSEPAFQDMNFNAISSTRKNQTASSSKKKGGADSPRVVLWHASNGDGQLMDPRWLIMAYEEHGRVLPVVSDFDCFTIGTRGLRYETPLSEDQVRLLQWCVSQIEEVLEKQQSLPSKASSWTSCWLEILKTSAAKGFHPVIPQFGFGDEQSYSIIESAVAWMEENGAVRHGAESFNYYFPQELDSEFLIVSDSLPGNVPWKYVDETELREFLDQKIDEGYTFPLNPKWVLCDEGWKVLYDRLLSSDMPHVQESLDIWFPQDSGVRQG